jgi:lipopolysaccharide transport system permease protein
LPTIIRPRSSPFVHLGSDFRELIAYRHLISSLFVREFKGRYRSSPSAIAFSLIAPLIQVAVMTIAIGFILNAGPKNLSAYILCATIPFGFFQASLMAGFSGIDLMQGLIKRIYFPREIFVITTVSVNFIQMVLSLLVFLVYRYGILVFVAGWPGMPPREVLWLPVLMLLTYFVTLGASLFTAAAFFYFEDVRFLVNIFLNLLFYLVPILYFAENIYYSNRISSHLIRSVIYHLYLANPIAWLVTAFKQIFFGQQIISQRGQPLLMSAAFDYRYFALTILSTIVFLVCGYVFFNSMKWKFAERP